MVVLAEGDPLFYGSFMYLHDRLADRYETEVVPGVPAFAAATAVLASPLVRQTDVLTVLPGTLDVPELARRLADTDGAVIMKLGRRFPGVVEALRQAGRLEHAMYVERASMPAERWMRVVDVDPASVPYFSIIVVPGDSLSANPGGRRSQFIHVNEHPGSAETLHVVGLGPGPSAWLTHEATEVLANVDHIVGSFIIARIATQIEQIPVRIASMNPASIAIVLRSLCARRRSHLFSEGCVPSPTSDEFDPIWRRRIVARTYSAAAGNAIFNSSLDIA